MKQKLDSARYRITDKNDYYKSSRTKEKTKRNQLNQIKENKNLFETSF